MVWFAVGLRPPSGGLPSSDTDEGALGPAAAPTPCKRQLAREPAHVGAAAAAWGVGGGWPAARRTGTRPSIVDVVEALIAPNDSPTLTVRGSTVAVYCLSITKYLIILSIIKVC